MNEEKWKKSWAIKLGLRFIREHSDVYPIFEAHYFLQLGDAYCLMKCMLLNGHTVLQGQSLINAFT